MTQRPYDPTNRPSIGGKETILAHIKIAVNRLAVDCIYTLSKEELSKVDGNWRGLWVIFHFHIKD